MRVLVIYNPTAGRRAAAQAAEDLRLRLKRAGDDVEVCETLPDGGARGPVGERAKELDRVVAIGGDGSLRETLAGLGERRCEVEVGLVPCGNANVVARELEIPLEIARALECATAGHTREIDVGLVQDEIFLAMVGIGWDARAVAYVAALRRRPLGRAAYRAASDALYAVAGLVAAARSTPEFAIHSDRHTYRCRDAIVCNSRVYGKGWSMYPEAGLETRSLHLHMALRDDLVALTRRLAVAVRRRRAPCELVRYVDSATADLDADAPVPVQIDGDDFGVHRTLELRLCPRGARVLVPGRAA